MKEDVTEGFLLLVKLMELLVGAFTRFANCEINPETRRKLGGLFPLLPDLFLLLLPLTAPRILWPAVHKLFTWPTLIIGMDRRSSWPGWRASEGKINGSYCEETGEGERVV